MVKSAGPTVRDRLLQAGVTVFSRNGFNGSSVQDIVEAAGVPKGSFYNHFESKEALGAAVISYYWEDKASTWLAILYEDTLPPLDRLRHYFDRVIADIEARGFTGGCFIGNMTAELSDHSSAVSTKLCDAYSCWTSHIAACIRLAQETGDLRCHAEPELLATFALNAWEGALLRARVTKSSLPLQQFLDILFSQLLT